jgi:hypothetical protein
MIENCFGQDMTANLGYYEGLPPLPGCQVYNSGNQTISGSVATCAQINPVLCEVPENIVTVGTSTVSVTVTRTFIVNTTSSQTITVISTSTEYLLSGTTSVLTRINGTTTVTSTETMTCACPSPCVSPGCCHCPSSSHPPHNSNANLGSGKSNSVKSGNSDNTNSDDRKRRMIARPNSTRPEREAKRIENDYSTCTTTFSNYVLVENNNPQGETPQQVCTFNGLNPGNVTLEAFEGGLGQLLTTCGASSAVALSWYGYEPACLLLESDEVTLVEGSAASATCLGYQWVLCRAGFPLVTTSTVFTGPFSTQTNTFTTTTVTFTTQTTTDVVIVPGSTISSSTTQTIVLSSATTTTTRLLSTVTTTVTDTAINCNRQI